MSTAADRALDRSSVPWLFVAALATTLPHFEHQPGWLAALAALIFAGAGWLWWRGTRLPGRWWLALAVIALCAAIVFEFRTLFGRDAGVGMLVAFMALKMLELRSRRDAYVILILGYFLLLTHYFYSQSIATGAWLLLSVVIVTAALVRLHGGPASTPRATLRYAGTLTLQAVPIMLIMYLLFPRVSGPLWGLPQDAHSARSGLSERMSPGSIANLALSSDIAFRARFDTAPPAKETLYWRGPVMEEYDGVTWRPAPRPNWTVPRIEGQAPPLRYAMTLEAHQQRWLLALDAPIALPPNSRIDGNLTTFTDRPLRQRQRLEFASVTAFRYNVDEAAEILQRNLRLPEGRNPRSRALGESWRGIANPEVRVAKALELFRQENFTYTLRPPLLGSQPVDDFLFDTRRGFCEHYAAAFVVLMRSAGVPARVIGGYQGGELNPLDGYVVVRQSDAHAWAEVWLTGKGWVRVDPTAAISPARVESGIAAAMPAGEPLPTLIQVNLDWLKQMRYRWEAVNNAWNQWVLEYNPERQRELLSRLGWPDADWRSLATALFGLCALALTLVAAWAFYQRPRIDPAQRLWRRALRKLRRRRIDCPPWETPLALVSRLQREHPEIAGAWQEAALCYCVARYGPAPADLDALRRALARLP